MSIGTPTSPSTFYPDTPLGSGFNAGELVFASWLCHFLCALGELTQSLSTYILTLKCVNMDLVGLSMKHQAPVPHGVGSPWVTAVITKINKPNTLIWPFKLSVLLHKLLLVFDQLPPFPHCSSVQSLSHVRLLATPWTAARQSSLSITNSWSLPKLMFIESVMPSNHLILCYPLACCCC